MLGLICDVMFTTHSAVNKIDFTAPDKRGYLGPVVRNVVSLTSLLLVKMLTVLVSTMSNSYLFFAEKM